MSVIETTYQDVKLLASVIIRSFAKDPLFSYLSGDSDSRGEVNDVVLDLHSRRLTNTLRNGYLYKLETESSECGGLLMIYEEPKPFSIKSLIGNTIAGLKDFWFPVATPDSEKFRFEAFMELHGKYYEKAMSECNGRMFYLEVIAVLPELHGKGFGKQLINKALQLADNTPIFLECTDSANIPFYTKYGFNLMAQETLSDNQTVISFMLKK